MCPHDLLCQCGAAEIRITETKSKLILEFKGTNDKNSHHLHIMHAGSSAPGVDGIKLYTSDYSDSDNSAKFQAFDLYAQRFHTALSCRSCAEKETLNASIGGI
jgi:hypothetical protein